jgi:autotransporter-associated beta strand protein
MQMRQLDRAATPIQSRLRMLPLAAGAAVTLSALAGAAFGQTYTWIGPTGTFSDGTKWQGGTAPVSDPGTALVFSSGNAAAITASNNIGSPFVVNSLTFDVNNAFTINSTTNSWQYQLDGPSPQISLNGLGTLSTFTTGGGLLLAADTTIGGAGPGNISLSGVISGGYGLTVSGGSPLRAVRVVTLGAANSFVGGLTLDGGTVNTANGNATTLGPTGTTVTVTPNGGTLGIAQGFTPPGSPIGTLQLNGDLHLVSNGGLVLATAVVQGSGALYENFSTGGLTINSDSSGYTGPVVVDFSELPNMGPSVPGTITLGAIAGQGSPTGSLRGVPSFDIRAGGGLLLNNNVTDSLQNGDRIGDTTPVNLRSGNLTLNGPAVVGPSGYTPAALTEQIGVLSGAGNSTVTVFPTANTGVVVTLQADRLERQEHGTFIFRGTALGDGATGVRGRILLTNPLAGSEFVGGGGAAGSLNINILPYAAGGTSTSDTGTSLVTYDTDGFRTLTATEYDPAVSAGVLSPFYPTSNVRLTGTTSNGATTTMNALVLANNGGTTDASVTGTGTLSLTSGVLISNPRNATATAPNILTNNIDFGSAEGIIYTVGNAGLKITGNLTGSNGLTKSGSPPTTITNTNVLILTGDNHLLTGPLTIDAGVVEFNSANALPGDSILANVASISTLPIGAALAYAGASPVTISRGVTVNTGYLTFKQFDLAASTQPSVGNLTVSGLISGTGNVNYQGQSPAITNAGQIYVTNTGNTYTGNTRFTNGNIHIAGDGCTGVGGGWSFAFGTSTAPVTLTLEGDVTNSRHVNFEGGGASSPPTFVINTNGHNMTLNGPITTLGSGTLTTGSGGFAKNGAGTLTLTSPVNTLPGVIAVNAGTLIINGNLGPSPTNALTVAAGATLGGSGTIWRNTTVAGTLAPGNSPGVLTIGGNLSLSSGATMSMQLNGAAPGSGYDQVVVNSTAASGPSVTLGAGTATLSATVGYVADASAMFWLIVNNNAATTTTGNFAGLPEGATVQLGTFAGRTYTGIISYNANATTGLADHSGNDVVIYNINWSPRCGSADFNCDGDVGTDSDIESFFACLAGTCPPAPCTSSADFNADGDVGTDADIEAFFRVLAGGTC